MSVAEIQLLIARLPQSEQEELLRALARELRAKASPAESTKADRDAWVAKLTQIQSLTASKSLRPSQEILDELRADRI